MWLAKTVEEKQAVAREAAIYPYKHAVVLTVDGAGNVWNPKEVYYAESGDSIPQKTRDAEIMNKRTNTYAMQLFNEEFATSYTAPRQFPPRIILRFCTGFRGRTCGKHTR